MAFTSVALPPTSIPIVLDEASRAGRIQRGDTVLLCGFGAGLTWGTGLFRW